MTSWKGKSRGGLFGHQFFAFILKHLNISLAYFILRFVAFYFLLFSPGSFKALYLFYRNRFGQSRLKIILSVYRHYITFGQVLLDKVSLVSGFDADYTFTPFGLEFIEEIVQKDRGGLIISSHFGGWESSGFAFDGVGPKPKILMLEAEHERIRHFMERTTSGQPKLDIISIKPDLSHIIKIGSTLRKRGLICLHGDRFLEGSKTIRVEFMGKPALFPVGPFAMAVKFNVPVSFVFCIKRNKREYDCIVTNTYDPSELSQAKNRQEKIAFLARQYVKSLENMVLKYPTQWFNFYDFWNEAAENPSI